jgi:glycerophosphoryl diester phosphodiesterase
LIIAHRGASRSCPENTFAAFDAAVAAGADAMELDVQLSQDGVPLVYHDGTLHKIDGSRHRVAQLTASELEARDFGAWFATKFRGEPIPTLHEVLERYPSRIELMLELKVDARDVGRRLELARSVVDRIRQHGASSRVWVLSFDGKALAAAHRRAPELRYVLNVADRPADDELRGLLKNFAALCLPGRLVTAALVDAVHELGRSVLAYRCDTARVARQVLRCDVDGLMADDPDWLRKFVSRQDGP